MINFEDKRQVSVEELKSIKTVSEDIAEYCDDITVSTKYYEKDIYKWNNQEVRIAEILSERCLCGFGIFIDNDLKYIMDFYEPHGISASGIEKGLIVGYGHEDIVLLFLDSGTFENIATR